MSITYEHCLKHHQVTLKTLEVLLIGYLKTYKRKLKTLKHYQLTLVQISIYRELLKSGLTRLVKTTITSLCLPVGIGLLQSLGSA